MRPTIHVSPNRLGRPCRRCSLPSSLVPPSSSAGVAVALARVATATRTVMCTIAFHRAVTSVKSQLSRQARVTYRSGVARAERLGASPRVVMTATSRREPTRSEGLPGTTLTVQAS